MTFEPRPTVFRYFQLQVKKLFFWCSTPGGWSHKDGIFHSSSIWGLWFPSEGVGSWHFSSLVLFYTAPFETEDWGWLTPTQALIVSCRFHSRYDRSKLLGIIVSSPFAHRGEFPCWEGQAKKTRGCQLPQGQLTDLECHSNARGPVVQPQLPCRTAKILIRGEAGPNDLKLHSSAWKEWLLIGKNLKEFHISCCCQKPWGP